MKTFSDCKKKHPPTELMILKNFQRMNNKEGRKIWGRPLTDNPNVRFALAFEETSSIKIIRHPCLVEELNDNGTTSPALLALLGDDIMTHTYVTLDQRALSRVVLAIASDKMANTMETPPLDLNVHELCKRGSTSDNLSLIHI